jgi:hypothetical protein
MSSQPITKFNPTSVSSVALAAAAKPIRSGLRRCHPSHHRPRAEKPRPMPWSEVQSRHRHQAVLLSIDRCAVSNVFAKRERHLRMNLAEGLASGRAFHVSASTVPPPAKPAPCWKFFTAISTSGPKMSSTVSSRFGVGAMHAGGVVPHRPWRQARSLVAPDSTCPYLLTFDISSLTKGDPRTEAASSGSGSYPLLKITHLPC